MHNEQPASPVVILDQGQPKELPNQSPSFKLLLNGSLRNCTGNGSHPATSEAAKHVIVLFRKPSALLWFL